MTDLTLTQAESDVVTAQRLAEVTPPRRPDRAPGVRPLAVVVGGQAGAAKSTIQGLVQSALGPDTTASYEADDDALAHPRSAVALRTGGLDAHSELVQSLPPDLSDRCLGHLLTADPPYDVVTSAWMESEERARQIVAPFRNAGYRVVAVFVATNEADSLLAVASRYQQAKDATGTGRWVDRRLHDRAYRDVPDTAHDLEAMGLVDDIYVVDRDGNVLYENHRTDDGTMAHPLGAKSAIVAGRNRPPTPAEHRYFVETARGLRLRGDELESPVDETVRAAMRKQVDRPVAEPIAQEAVPENRLDRRMAALQHLTGDGVAPPDTIKPPDSAPPARGSDSGGTSPNRSLDR